MSRSHRGWVDPHAGIPGRRLFVATPLPSAIVDAVSEVVEAVRSQALPAGAHDVRWVRLDGLHLTLRFLGPTPDERIGPTSDAVDRAAAAMPPIEATIAGAGTFPPTGRPRTIWLGLVDGIDDLSALAGLTARELITAGWPSDDRPFRPHLTLARSDGIGAGRLVADRLAAAMEGRRLGFGIERIGVYESVTGGGPARYVPVHEATLAGTPEGTSVYHPNDP